MDREHFYLMFINLFISDWYDQLPSGEGYADVNPSFSKFSNNRISLSVLLQSPHSTGNVVGIGARNDISSGINL